MRLKDAVAVVEKVVTKSEHVDRVEYEAAVRCLLAAGKRILGARKALRDVAALVNDPDHLNQGTLFEEG